MVTLEDIALEAKVSPSAVSKVINGRVGISASTRGRVEAVIRRLNYRAPGPGRPLKNSKAMNVAVVYSQQATRGSSLTPLTTSWISAMRREMASLEGHICVFSGALRCGEDAVFQHALKQHEFDGAILIGMADDSGYLSALREVDLPVVVMNRCPEHNEFSWVEIDNYGGGYAAAKKFLDLGHRHIAIIAGNPSHAIVSAKIQGFEAALASQNLRPACLETVEWLNFEPVLESVCTRVLASQATSVFIMGDHLTIRCLDAWAAKGIAIPQQLSVIGFDDLGITSEAGLRPTSVGYDKEMMGREAVRMLVRLLSERPAMRAFSTVAGTSIVEGDTTAEAPIPKT